MNNSLSLWRYYNLRENCNLYILWQRRVNPLSSTVIAKMSHLMFLIQKGKQSHYSCQRRQSTIWYAIISCLIQLAFEGIRGASYRGDAAIDDVRVFDCQGKMNSYQCCVVLCCVVLCCAVLCCNLWSNRWKRWSNRCWQLRQVNI